MENSTVIRLEKPVEQTVGAIKRVIGFVKPKDFIPFFDTVTLDANPRSAKANRVTKDIMSSIEENPTLFQFKSKGILLGARRYDVLERGRSYRLYFGNPKFEGLLDGGHNMLALGTHMLGKVISERKIKKLAYWRDLLEAWVANKDKIREIEEKFNFNVPVEILVPTNVDDDQVVREFGKALAEICKARNNNSQLTTEAMDNRWGLYDEIGKYLPEQVRVRVEWRTNDWEDPTMPPLKARRIISLAWLPLGILDEKDLLPARGVKTPRGHRKWVNLETGASALYSVRGDLSTKFGELMRHDDVSNLTTENIYKIQNASVLSALKILGDLPELHDLIYSRIINSIPKGGGLEKNLEGVKKKQTKTPYTNSACEYDVPLGYVMPILFGLKSLMHVESKEVVWKYDPEKFILENMGKIGKCLREIFQFQSTFDPQKIGKNQGSYTYMAKEMDRMIQ